MGLRFKRSSSPCSSPPPSTTPTNSRTTSSGQPYSSPPTASGRSSLKSGGPSVKKSLGSGSSKDPSSFKMSHELNRQQTRSFGKDTGPYEYGVVHQPKRHDRPVGRRTADNEFDNSGHTYVKSEYEVPLKQTDRFTESLNSLDTTDARTTSSVGNTWERDCSHYNIQDNVHHSPRPKLPMQGSHQLSTIESCESHGVTNPEGVSQSNLRRVGNSGEDLARILAKYGSLSRKSSGKSDKANEIAGVLRTNTTTLRISTDSCFAKAGSKAPEIRHWDSQTLSVEQVGQYEINVKQQGNAPRAISQGEPAPLSHPASEAPVETAQAATQIKGPVQLRRSYHVFPFKETTCGHLVVDPEQIAFESRKISVLMVDPNNNAPNLVEYNASSPAKPGAHGTNMFCLNRNERLLYEIKKAMCLPVDDIQDKTMYLKAPCPNSSREVPQRKYSDSRKATAYFEEKILNRIVNAKNADTHVVIGDKVFPCHSIALEAFSAYFEKRNRAPMAVQRIDLSEAEVSGSIFPVIMDWIAQSEVGRAEIITKENLVSLYAAAKHLEIRDLQEQCLSFLERNIEMNDPELMTMWDFVKKRHPSLSELVRIISQKLAANFQEIYKSKTFLKLEVEELFMLLNSDDISIQSEMDVYDSAVTWLLHDWKTRKIYTNKLMSSVRFGLLSPLQLTQINLCPELTKIKSETDNSPIKEYGTVKSMIDDGLAFSILDDSYKNQPDELRKWMTKTGVKAPAHRSCLTNRKRNQPKPLIQERISLLEDSSQTKLLTYERPFENPPEEDVDSRYEYSEEASRDHFGSSNYTMASDLGENSRTSIRELRARPPKPPSSAGSSVNDNYIQMGVQDYSNTKPRSGTSISISKLPMYDPEEQNDHDNEEQDNDHYDNNNFS